MDILYLVGNNTICDFTNLLPEIDFSQYSIIAFPNPEDTSRDFSMQANPSYLTFSSIPASSWKDISVGYESASNSKSITYRFSKRSNDNHYILSVARKDNGADLGIVLIINKNSNTFRIN